MEHARQPHCGPRVFYGRSVDEVHRYRGGEAQSTFGQRRARSISSACSRMRKRRFAKSPMLTRAVWGASRARATRRVRRSAQSSTNWAQTFMWRFWRSMARSARAWASPSESTRSRLRGRAASRLSSAGRAVERGGCALEPMSCCHSGPITPAPQPGARRALGAALPRAEDLAWRALPQVDGRPGKAVDRLSNSGSALYVSCPLMQAAPCPHRKQPPIVQPDTSTPGR